MRHSAAGSRWKPATSFIAQVIDLEWCRHPGLNWGPTDYESVERPIQLISRTFEKTLSHKHFLREYKAKSKTYRLSRNAFRRILCCRTWQDVAGYRGVSETPVKPQRNPGSAESVAIAPQHRGISVPSKQGKVTLRISCYSSPGSRHGHNKTDRLIDPQGDPACP